MALLKGEGTHQILYGAADIFSGLRHNRGYLARPTHSGAFPTIILAHGVDGITSSVKAFARRLARYGLAVVGPDLYRGRVDEWPAEQRVVGDLADAASWTESSDTPWVQPGTFGLLAFDQAAHGALAFADEFESVGAIALSSPVLDRQVAPPRSPVLGFYGKADSMGDAQARLPQAEWVLYGDVGAGLIDESADDYRWDVAEDVADRTVRHFAEALKA